MKKRKDGRYKKTFTFNGKPYSALGKTKAEAEQKAIEKRLALESGKESHDNPTLNEFYARWEKQHDMTCKESTSYNCRRRFDKFASIKVQSMSRCMGDMPIRDITVDDLRRAQDYLLKDCNLSESTVNLITTVMGTVFKSAKAERVIDFNPFECVHQLRYRKDELETHRALTPDEAREFFNVAFGTYYYNLYTLAIETGMRLGELGAISLSSIKDGFIYVSRTITRDINGHAVIGDTPKTDKGIRKIPLTDKAKEAIESQRVINMMLFGDKVVSLTDPIFKTVRGSYLTPSSVKRDLADLCGKAGIEYFTMHTFRVTFCTRLILAGVPVKTVQDLMGHSSFKMTMDVYCKVMDDSRVDAMEKLQNYVASV